MNDVRYLEIVIWRSSSPAAKSNWWVCTAGRGRGSEVGRIGEEFMEEFTAGATSFSQRASAEAQWARSFGALLIWPGGQAAPAVPLLSVADRHERGIWRGKLRRLGRHPARQAIAIAVGGIHRDRGRRRHIDRGDGAISIRERWERQIERILEPPCPPHWLRDDDQQRGSYLLHRGARARKTPQPLSASQAAHVSPPPPMREREQHGLALRVGPHAHHRTAGAGQRERGQPLPDPRQVRRARIMVRHKRTYLPVPHSVPHSVLQECSVRVGRMLARGSGRV